MTTPTSSVTHDEPTLLYAIKQVELAVRAHMDALLKPMNITALQYTALTVLRRKDGLSSAELARNSFVTAQTMGEMLATLERRGLVIRQTDPGNRRRTLNSVTAAGKTLLDDHAEKVAELEERMVAGLNIRQREALRGYLNSCRQRLGSVAAQ